MKIYSIEKYELIIITNPDKTYSIRIESIQNNNRTAFEKDRRKLYIIYKNEKEIFYVGEANTSIKTRFQRGCTRYNYFVRNKKALMGYKGYKWLDIKNNPDRNLFVIVVIFNKKYDPENKRTFIESIEGEVVLNIRNKLGYWPKFQNEIHFHNEKGSKEVAEDIIKEVLKESRNDNL